MSDAEEQVEKPMLKVPFLTLFDEGDWLLSKGEYKKALECFSTALILKPDEKKCRIGQAKCYMKMGLFQEALREAETSLEDDNSFYEGLYQKAEALCHMGNFPFALVFYHRGQKVRPQMAEFKLGIQKAQDAIRTAVSGISIAKPHMKKDVPVSKKDEEKKTPQTEKPVKQKYGDLSDDQIFLEELMKDQDLVSSKTKTGEDVGDIIQSSLTLINNCKEFLSHEKPPNAQERKRQPSHKKSRPPTEPAQFMLKNLKSIDADLASGNAEISLKNAEEVLKIVQSWPEKEVPNKKEFLASLHCCIGNAWFDLGDMDQALKNYQRELELAKHSKCPEEMSKALDKLGRTYVEIEDFTQALKFFKQMIPLVQDDLEKTCLFYNIGCCYMELYRLEEAKQYGIHSAAAAHRSADETWQVYANVLVAMSELKLGNVKSSVSRFEKALSYAQDQEDDSIQNLLQKALDDAKQLLQN